MHALEWPINSARIVSRFSANSHRNLSPQMKVHKKGCDATFFENAEKFRATFTSHAYFGEKNLLAQKQIYMNVSIIPYYDDRHCGRKMNT